MADDQKEIQIEIPSEFDQLFTDWWRHGLIEGGRYSLKSHTAARYVLLLASRSRCRIACLRQFMRNINDSSYQLLVDLIEQYKIANFKITKDEIVNVVTGSNIIFKGLDRNVETTIKSLEGIDLAWIDEAQTITRNSIRILIPTIRKPGSRMLWTMNRITDIDPILSFLLTNPPRDDVWHLEVDYRIAEKYGWLSKEISAEIEFARINHPEDYAHDYLGKALNQSDRSILPVSRVIESMNRGIDAEGAIEIGADIARMGSDRTEFVKRKGLKEIDRKTYTKLRTTDVCDRLELFAGHDKNTLIKVDDTGVGGGVTDEMLKRGYNVMAINFGSSASDKDKYPNLISEAWFYLQSVIDQIKLANDKDLLTELSSREWVMDSKGRRQVESKDAYKKRGYRSPDKADATILCFYTPPKSKPIERSVLV